MQSQLRSAQRLTRLLFVLALTCWRGASDHQAAIRSLPDGSPLAGPDVVLHLGLQLDATAATAAPMADPLRVCLVHRHVPDEADQPTVDALEVGAVELAALEEGSGFESEVSA